jgi:uridylate kinase
MENVWVISLGGSRIVPNSVDDKFLLRFKELINSHPSKKFVVVTGGGSTARKYISALKKIGKKTEDQSLEGIAITRLHANFMMRIFGKSANEDLPTNMEKVKNLLAKNHIVFCGGLRWSNTNSTTDGTAAKLAGFLKCPFINLTNVQGLYSEDPMRNKNAKFIPRISWDDFYKMMKNIKFKAGQHFVLDQSAAKTIKEKKVVTYIVGSLSAIDAILDNKKFMGTVIK